ERAAGNGNHGDVLGDIRRVVRYRYAHATGECPEHGATRREQVQDVRVGDVVETRGRVLENLCEPLHRLQDIRLVEGKVPLRIEKVPARLEQVRREVLERERGDVANTGGDADQAILAVQRLERLDEFVIGRRRV